MKRLFTVLVPLWLAACVPVGGEPAIAPSASPTASPDGTHYGDKLANPPTTPAVTLALYQSITTGMAYEDVCLLFGRPGEQVTFTSLSAESSAVYEWSNVDGSNAQIWFKNDQVSSKSAANLH